MSRFLIHFNGQLEAIFDILTMTNLENVRSQVAIAVKDENSGGLKSVRQISV